MYRNKISLVILTLLLAISQPLFVRAAVPEGIRIPGTAARIRRDSLRDKLSELSQEYRPDFASPQEFYENSVFVGDSIMLGFRNYCAKRSTDPLLSRLTFLAAGSFGANNALKPVGGDSVHPVYKGEQRPVWDSIAMTGCTRVFILVGLNDLNIKGLAGSLEKYKELVAKIKETTPGAEFNIFSMPYVLAGSEKGNLNNDSIRKYNESLKAWALSEGYGYLDIAGPLSDEQGNLAPKYCSDGFLHQTPAAYDVWVEVLKEFPQTKSLQAALQPAGR